MTKYHLKLQRREKTTKVTRTRDHSNVQTQKLTDKVAHINLQHKLRRRNTNKGAIANNQTIGECPVYILTCGYASTFATATLHI